MISRQPGKRALLFILVTVLIDTMGMGVIIPVIPELIMELTGEGLSRAAVYGGWLGFVGAIMVMGQSTLPRIAIPRFGERRTALVGFVAGGAGYLGYAFATEG